jgi:hypothetical protein
METKGIVVIAIWICVTILTPTIVWVSGQFDLWTLVFVLFLLVCALATYAMSYPGFWIKQPTTLSENQLNKITKQLEELNKQVNYIKKQLEE